MKALSAVALLLVVATVGGKAARSPVPMLIELLRGVVNDQSLSIYYHNCQSWHLAVETGNIDSFQTVPENCEHWVKHYMGSAQYQADSKTVCKEAYFFAKGLALKNDTINAFVFDVDDTLISTLPYYAEHGYGTEVTDPESFYKWARKGNAPVLPETLLLFNNLVYRVGLKAILVSERDESLKHVTLRNVHDAGYPWFEKVFFKPRGSNLNNAEYKASVLEDLENKGYTIIGTIGDQWSDLTGKTAGKRTFKLPNALYHTA